jgi:hypothetical protein
LLGGADFRKALRRSLDKISGTPNFGFSFETYLEAVTSPLASKKAFSWSKGPHTATTFIGDSSRFAD